MCLRFVVAAWVGGGGAVELEAGFGGVPVNVWVGVLGPASAWGRPGNLSRAARKFALAAVSAFQPGCGGVVCCFLRGAVCATSKDAQVLAVVGVRSVCLLLPGPCTLLELVFPLLVAHALGAMSAPGCGCFGIWGWGLPIRVFPTVAAWSGRQMRSPWSHHRRLQLCLELGSRRGPSRFAGSDLYLPIVCTRSATCRAMGLSRVVGATRGVVVGSPHRVVAAGQRACRLPVVCWAVGGLRQCWGVCVITCGCSVGWWLLRWRGLRTSRDADLVSRGAGSRPVVGVLPPGCVPCVDQPPHEVM